MARGVSQRAVGGGGGSRRVIKSGSRGGNRGANSSAGNRDATGGRSPTSSVKGRSRASSTAAKRSTRPSSPGNLDAEAASPPDPGLLSPSESGKMLSTSSSSDDTSEHDDDFEDAEGGETQEISLGDELAGEDFQQDHGTPGDAPKPRNFGSVEETDGEAVDLGTPVLPKKQIHKVPSSSQFVAVDLPLPALHHADGSTTKDPSSELSIIPSAPAAESRSQSVLSDNSDASASAAGGANSTTAGQKTARRFWERLRAGSSSEPNQAPKPPSSNDGASEAGSRSATPDPGPRPTLPARSGASAPGAPQSSSVQPIRKSTFAMPTLSSLAAAAQAAAAAGSAAAADWAASRNAAAVQEPAERQRLPRFQVDEAKLAEDVMRFADARDTLHNERSPERLRELGNRLEEGWREKLSETAVMREKLEQAQLSIYDVEDENKNLRLSLKGLSEQIASLESAFHTFQLSTIEQMRKEKELFEEERREELEISRYEVAQGKRELAETKAINAQLRLVVLSGLRNATGLGSELAHLDPNAKTGLESRLRAIERGEHGSLAAALGSPPPSATLNTPMRALLSHDGASQAQTEGSHGESSAADESEKSGAATSTDRTSFEEGDTLEASVGANGQDGEIDETSLLFDLPISPTTSRPVTMLFNEPVHIAKLNHLLGLTPAQSGVQEPIAEADEGQTIAIPESASAGGASSAPAAGRSLLSPGSSPGTARSATIFAGHSVPASAAVPHTPHAPPALAAQLTGAKMLADEEHQRAVKEENETLRIQLKNSLTALRAFEQEADELRHRLKQTEAAVEGLFNSH
ncbi:hypothetical protein IE81DRAFT_130809 [Ceraceosorus guamensis]|uniref:Uncharacterized protein n=1 Tax=Ceraceosorus guamensis TaxID=1522189 RepID=A0A316W8N4_9BASI|nr:hypothetical protein IE81DRAFT_130809 [Ceraceosorus guamensis]PWN45924.1 hypothetical protein IE81DRAFT_130809 [Ceraceosorus guamensis]